MYQTVRSHITEDDRHHSQYRKNLKPLMSPVSFYHMYLQIYYLFEDYTASNDRMTDE
jgi:hypothetical protein